MEEKEYNKFYNKVLKEIQRIGAKELSEKVPMLLPNAYKYTNYGKHMQPETLFKIAKALGIK